MTRTCQWAAAPAPASSAGAAARSSSQLVGYLALLCIQAAWSAIVLDGDGGPTSCIRQGPATTAQASALSKAASQSTSECAPSSVHLTMSVAMQRCIMSSCSSLSRNSPADDLHTNSKQWYLLRGCWLVQGANRAPAGRSAARRRERPPPSGCPPSRAASQGSRTGPAKAWPAAARWPEKQSKVTFLAAPERHPESSTP